MTGKNQKMRVLVACEYSGTVRDAFIRAGHDAMSCDLLPTDVPGPHYEGSVFDILDDGWDLMIGHPPCTYLTLTGNKWFKPEFAHRFPDRHRQREEAVEFFRKLYECSIPKVCLENPVGVLSTLYMKATQYIHPYQFGDPHSKKTGLWLKNLPPLVPTKTVEPQFHVYKDGRRDPIWHYESMRMPPLERMKYRSKTFQGIADAMAAQWGEVQAIEQIQITFSKPRRMTVRDEIARLTKELSQLRSEFDAYKARNKSV